MDAKEEKFCLVCSRKNDNSIVDKDGVSSSSPSSGPVEDFRESFRFGGSDGNLSLNKQLWNIFIVRKLLCLPRHLCKEILQVSNGFKNPSLWFTVCQECQKYLMEAWELHNQILGLENKLKTVGEQLQNQIKKAKKSRKKDDDNDDQSSRARRGTPVEKRIWRWLLRGGPCVPERAAVKREVASPEPEGFSDFEPADNDPLWDPVLSCEPSIIDENMDVVMKTEIDYQEQEETQPRKRKKRGAGKDKRVKLKINCDDDGEEKDEEDKTGSGEEDGEKLEKVSRRRGRSSKTGSSNVGEKGKAETSLGSKNTPSRKGRVVCKRCPAVFRNDAELAPHSKLHEKCDAMDNEFDCKTCNYPCESERNLRQHMSLKHERQKYVCDVCGYQAPGKGRLARHKKQHMNMIDEKTYQCEVCQEKFTNYNTFTRHQRKEHAQDTHSDKGSKENQDVDPDPTTINEDDPVWNASKFLDTDPDYQDDDGPGSVASDGSYNQNSFSGDDDEEEDKKKEKKKKKKGSSEKVPGRRGRPRKSTLVKSSRSKDSVRKAKTSLRANKSNVMCSRCPAVFQCNAKLTSHNTMHDKCDEMGNEFECKTCGYPFDSERSMKLHMSMKHGVQKCICDVCGYQAPSKGRLEGHKKKHKNLENAKTYQCFICQENFSTYTDLTRHQRKEHATELNINLFRCEKCPSVYTTNKSLQDHILHVHEKNLKWCCDICGKGLLNENNLKEHLETHERREKSEICWVCGVDFLNNRSLREHIRKFHPNANGTKDADVPLEKNVPEKEYKCLYCTFTSPFRVVVMRHRKTHREIFRHVCDICSNEYTALASLQQHKIIAHGDGQTIAQCEWCQKSFAHKRYLRMHIPRCKTRPPDVLLSESSRKPFKDSMLVVPEGFANSDFSNVGTKQEYDGTLSGSEDPTTSADPSLPLLAPTEPKIYVCKYCNDYKTDNRGKLGDHVTKTHKSEMWLPFTCEVCGRSYSTDTSLYRHIAMHHTTENSVTCNFCNKTFKHWNSLRFHYKYSCPLMPPGTPVPEQPNRKVGGGGSATGKDSDGSSSNPVSVRIQRNRGTGIRKRKPPGSAPTKRKRRQKKKPQEEEMTFDESDDGGGGSGDGGGGGRDDSSMEDMMMEHGAQFSLGQQQQPSTSSTSQSTFPLLYPHQTPSIGGMTFETGNLSVAAAAAAATMQMFGTPYGNNPQAGSSSSSRFTQYRN